MREQKFHIYLDSHERTILLHSLVELKNQLLAQGRYADCVDELIFKVTGAPLKKLKVQHDCAVETLREKTITPLLEADATYQEDSDNEGIAEMHYLQLDLTEEQRKVCNRLLECRDKQDIEYATHAYIAGLYDAFQIMAVLFPDKWDTDDIRELLAAKVNN